MKVRYKSGSDGVCAVARIYSREEHGIDKSLIDRDAVTVVSRLSSSGFESYIVGGAVRDLLLGKTPKDFDVATSASPRQVHRIFRNSRIIGRRFRIVHVAFGQKIIEVSTFRSTKDHEENRDNTFGTIEEDASRRDFSINSLYYDPAEETIIDFNNAMEDFRQKKITSLIPLYKTFNDDPVRMLRAVKYHVTTGFRFRFGIAGSIKAHAPLLQTVSSSRLTEELNKILASGYSAGIIRELAKYRLLVYLLPCYSVHISKPGVLASLEELDEKIMQQKKNPDLPEISRSVQYLSLCEPLIAVPEENLSPSEKMKDILRQIKVLLSPNTPPNYELENSARLFMKNSGIRLPQSSKRTAKKKIIPAGKQRRPVKKRRKVRPTAESEG